MPKTTGGIALMVAAGLLCSAGPAAAQGNDAGPESGLRLATAPSEAEDILRSEMDEAETGDGKLFKVVTDTNVAGLEIGDVYKNNMTYFQVVNITSKGEKRSKFTVKRIKGIEDPGKTWTRVAGLGPLTIESLETMLGRILSGGPLMYPIAFLLLVTIIIALNSLRIYRRGRQIPNRFVGDARQAIAEANLQRFEDMALREKGLFGHLCQAMAKGFQVSTVDDIRNRCEIMGSKQVNLLRTPLKTLSFVAAVAPLLGLLGTVVGIIMCFESLEGQAASIGKAQAMAKGIKVALLTTAAGLSVAVPTLLIYFIFNTRLNLIVSDCETTADEFIHELAGVKRAASDAGDPAPAPPPPVRKEPRP